MDLVAMEKDKIKGAIRTDFILSAEIIVITLGTVSAASFGTQVSVLVGIALIMTVGVYGLVAGIVKLDDLGFYLVRQDSKAAQALGRGILAAAPWMMKSLAVIGTAAMFLVGGSIILHGVPAVHHLLEPLLAAAGGFSWLVQILADGMVGVLTGALVLAGVSLVKKIIGAAKG
ncbi:Inner membrane protein YedI [compost metagenome]